mmetsp:Transcript_16756/g.47819  ORF Transcript_16756/g.47819 Transcript_16756/m.47819 type:complete len:247 (+) Transcript_16756:228-968(+)
MRRRRQFAKDPYGKGYCLQTRSLQLRKGCLCASHAAPLGLRAARDICDEAESTEAAAVQTTPSAADLQRQQRSADSQRSQQAPCCDSGAAERGAVPSVLPSAAALKLGLTKPLGLNLSGYLHCLVPPWHSHRARCACERSSGHFVAPCHLLGARATARIYGCRAQWARVLALSQPPGDAGGVEAVATWQLHHAGTWTKLCKTDATLAAAAVRSHAPWEAVDEVTLDDVPLRHPLVQLVEHVEVLGL